MYGTADQSAPMLSLLMPDVIVCLVNNLHAVVRLHAAGCRWRCTIFAPAVSRAAEQPQCLHVRQLALHALCFLDMPIAGALCTATK